MARPAIGPAFALLVAVLVAGCAAPATKKATYVNPVLDRDFPDPAVLCAPDGAFYAYATQSWTPAGMLNIQVARSADLVSWQHLGDALPEKPAWGRTKQNFWAPHVVYDAAQRKYFMYYSAERDDARGKCLAVATAASPAGPFADSGRPMLCGPGFEQIDPMAFDDPRSGKRLLYWGSGFKPIRVQELAQDRLAFQPGSRPIELIDPGPDRSHASLVEAPWVVERDGTYFLFYSRGLCCGQNARYWLQVARADSALGPFERHARDGVDVPLLENNGFWRAPGHNSVVRDAAGDDWALYHAIDAARAYFEDRLTGRWSSRPMLLDPIEYANGWPSIRHGQPSVASETAPPVNCRKGTP